ncbi:Dihydroorotase [Candidatus Izimaplasma bacterium HR1]|jgi:dihydroorotase|uniref:dihydroorotase n=1 Tax=Candidatus Izimoplasma sp. HR1 TaxID=1541959 RepID=UPI0004F73EFA|nr:Dihydroorotase [Candidatus Izimaplasma bacterium HR1]
MGILLKNGQVLIKKELERKDILIEGDIISRIDEDILEDNHKIIDCENLFISPGLIDMHVHLREPGYENKETILTGTKAAAKGGYSLVCAMPNTKPAPDNIKTLNHILDLINEKALIKVLPYATITEGQNNFSPLVDMDQMKNKVCGFSNDGYGIQSTRQMYDAMHLAHLHETLIAAHCEDEEILFGGYVHKGNKAVREGWDGITSLSESIQIARDTLIAEETKAKYHVCHISTKEGVRIVRDAKKRGVNVTCEVTPHHLLLTENDVLDGNTKMNPPVRELKDKYALISGLLDGTIDMISTDHAPHTEDEKQKGLKEAPFGIVGLETAFPLIYTNFVESGIASLHDIVKWFSYNPAKRLNLGYGKLLEGRVADITIIDLHTEKEINKNDFVSKGKNTPFDKWVCKGWPLMTIVDGKIVYEEGVFYE